MTDTSETSNLLISHQSKGLMFITKPPQMNHRSVCLLSVGWFIVYWIQWFGFRGLFFRAGLQHKMWFHSGSLYEFLNSFLFAYDCPCPWVNTLDWLGKRFSYTLFAGRKRTAQEKYGWIVTALKYPMRLPGCRSCSFIHFIDTRQVHLRDSLSQNLQLSVGPAPLPVCLLLSESGCCPG